MSIGFRKFLKSPLRNAWIMERTGNSSTLHVYVRRSIIPSHEADFDLANMHASKPGRGALTRFLDRWEPFYRFRIEQVLNPRLEAYLMRRGYTIQSRDLASIPTLIGPKPTQPAKE